MPTDNAGLDQILGFHIRLAHGSVTRQFTANFAELGLTQKQISVLWLAHDNPGIAQTDLCKSMQMDRATTMAIVHALERRGLLSRMPCDGDRRRIGFRLTDAGERAFREAQDAIAQHEAWLTSKFSPSERSLLVELLSRIHG